MLAPNLMGMFLVRLRASDGGGPHHEGGPSDFGHDGVAVTPRTPYSTNDRSTALSAVLSAAMRWLLVAALTAATARTALAQGSPAPAAGAAGAASPQQAPVPAASPPLPSTPPAPPGLTLPPQPAPPDAAEAPTLKRGFLNDLGRWWDEFAASFKAKMKEQQSKLDDFNKKSADAAKGAADATSQAVKNAADAVVRLPTSRVIEIQEICPLAGNGAADCAVAATKACKGKGFSAGQPLDVRTAEKCTNSLWMSGQPASNDCPIETVVLRAACQ